MNNDIPQVYLDEAVQRLNFERAKAFGGEVIKFWSSDDYNVQVLALTLQELGWEPPVDPKEALARKVAAAVCEVMSRPVMARFIREGRGSSPIEKSVVQAALIALTEGMVE
jgi:hypothetical protein